MPIVIAHDLRALRRSSELLAFSSRVRAELAAALQVAPSRVEVLDVQLDQPPGRLTVEVELAEGGGPSVPALRRALATQLAAPSSALRQSALFTHAEAPARPAGPRSPADAHSALAPPAAGGPAGGARRGRRPSIA